MPDASPVKWHLAHTTWFFETLVLTPHAPAYRPYDGRYGYLFNSYYELLGDRHPRPQRGLITRPSGEEILSYRRHVDAAIKQLLEDAWSTEIAWACETGLQHEQQHQELILTDIKHALSCNPLLPAYSETGGESESARQRRLHGAITQAGFTGSAARRGILHLIMSSHAIAFCSRRSGLLHD